MGGDNGSGEVCGKTLIRYVVQIYWFLFPASVCPLTIPVGFVASSSLSRSRWVNLHVKLVTWQHLNFNVVMRTSTRLYSIIDKVQDRHGGSIGDIILYRHQVRRSAGRGQGSDIRPLAMKKERSV